MDRKYPFTAYDKYLTLKMGPGLWLVMAYLLMPYTVTIMSVVKKRGDRMELINLVYPHRSSLAISALVSVVVFGLVYAWARRSPVAPPHVRWLWHRGRVFLLAALIVNVLVLFAPVFYQGYFVFTRLFILNLIVSGLMIAYVLTSTRVRDTFADYPEATLEELAEREKAMKAGKSS